MADTTGTGPRLGNRLARAVSAVRGGPHRPDDDNRLVAELREDRDFSQTLLQSLHDGVVVVGTDRRVIEINTRWCEMTGFARETLLGSTPPYPWWHPVHGAETAAEADRFFSGQVRGEFERIYRRADGVALPVLLTVAPVLGADGRPRAFVATCKDMTERRRAETALAAYTDQLEQANADLAEANQFKTDLMSMLSHEIGQPLTSISTFSELVCTNWDDLSEAQRLDDVRKIHASARRLFELVGDMLLMFRLDADSIMAGRVPAEVATALDAAAGNLTGLEDLRRRIDPDLVVLADPGQLRQVLLNLLSNAVQHGAPPVEVEASRHGDRVLIAVVDHGEGVPEDLVPHLFGRFRQAGGGAARRGSGLGLFSVRQLVEANGGTIRYERIQPSGSRFVVELDVADEAAVSVHRNPHHATP